MVRILVKKILGDSWIEIQRTSGPRTSSLRSDYYSSISNARRAAEKWGNDIPDSEIIDLTRER